MPLSSMEQLPREKSTEILILVASASSEFVMSPVITLLREVMITEDLIWATTSPGSGLMDMAVAHC